MHYVSASMKRQCMLVSLQMHKMLCVVHFVMLFDIHLIMFMPVFRAKINMDAVLQSLRHHDTVVNSSGDESCGTARSAVVVVLMANVHLLQMNTVRLLLGFALGNVCVCVRVLHMRVGFRITCGNRSSGLL